MGSPTYETNQRLWPAETEELVKAAVQYFTISAEIRIADGGRTVPIAQVFFGHDVGTGMIYQDANIKVTAVENSHFSFHKDPCRQAQVLFLSF